MMDADAIGRRTIRGSGPVPEGLSVALADPLRTHVLFALATGAGPMSFDDLAVAVAAYEALRTEDSPTTDDVAVDLYHRHLPKLRDAGLLEDADAVDGVELTAAGAGCARRLGVLGRR